MAKYPCHLDCAIYFQVFVCEVSLNFTRVGECVSFSRVGGLVDFDNISQTPKYLL